MKNFKIVLICVCIVCMMALIMVSITHDIEKINYPIYSNSDEILSLQKDAETVNQELGSINYAVPIFMYHWVRDDTGGYPYPENMVRPDTLKEQVEYLTQNGYETIFIGDIANITNYNKPVALTFDDGFQCFYVHAFPILKFYKVKATLFVITEYVDTPGYVTLEQLKEIKESGLVDIQAHTATHPYLANLSVSEMYDQMKRCNDYLKEKLDINSDIICYPYGSYNSNTIEQAKKMGYKYGLAMDGGVHYSDRDSAYELSRIYANRSMSINTFKNYAEKSFVKVNWK